MNNNANYSASNPVCMHEWLNRRVSQSPERRFITFEDETWTRREFKNKVDHLAGILVEIGVNPGDRVGYFGLDHSLVLAVLFAAVKVGAIFVPINYRLSSYELTDIIKDCDLNTLIYGHEYFELVNLSKNVLPELSILMVEEVLTTLSKYEIDSSEVCIPKTVISKPSDIVMLIYTSGTTGVPKGVMISNENIWMSNIGAILANGFNKEDIAINCSPLFHAAGLNSIVLPILMVGGHLILQRNFNEINYLRDIEKYKVTIGLLVPTMMIRLCQVDRFSTADVSNMRLLLTGGAPVPEAILKIYNSRGIVTNQSYGMTETSSAVVILESEYAVSKLGSCGRPTLLAEVKIIDKSGESIDEPFSRGEICIRGPSVSRGYWNRPKETAEAFSSDGWLKSGDLGYADEDGFIYICGRNKDMIVSGGENIYAAEIENVLYEHPMISEAAIIGCADEKWGERVVAVVVLKEEGVLSLDSLIKFSETQLARYKLPKELHIVDSLPKTSSGKISKLELRKLYSE